MKNSEVLSRCALFAGIREDERSAMLDCLGAREAATVRGGYVFREGDRAEWVGIVLSGQVQVVREDFYGNRSIMTEVSPAGLFGEVFACADVERYPVSVEVVQEGAVVLMSLARILRVCTGGCAFDNRLVSNLLRIVAGKNLQLNQKIEITSQRTTRDKLMTYLATAAKKAGSRTFEIPFNRQGLADYLGVERSALSAEIGRLRREGILQSERSVFTLL